MAYLRFLLLCACVCQCQHPVLTFHQRKNTSDPSLLTAMPGNLQMEWSKAFLNISYRAIPILTDPLGVKRNRDWCQENDSTV